MSELRDAMRQVKVLRDSYRLAQRWKLRLQGLEWLKADVQCDSVFIGTDYAGWTVCPRLIAPGMLAYCAGVGMDASFDLGLIERYQVTVHAFDPTPVSLRWVQSRSWPAQWTFHPVGLGGSDGVASFAPPAVDGHASFSITADKTPGSVEAPIKRLSTLARELGHREIGLLKLDIEGAEFDVLEDMIATNLRPAQILVEFHPMINDPEWARTREMISNLRAAGYRTFNCKHDGMNLSFGRRDLLH